YNIIMLKSTKGKNVFIMISSKRHLLPHSPLTFSSCLIKVNLTFLFVISKPAAQGRKRNIQTFCQFFIGEKRLFSEDIWDTFFFLLFDNAGIGEVAGCRHFYEILLQVIFL